MNHYGLDPTWYFSAPGLSRDATLKITKVQLEILSDPDILLMIECGIRGGIATISHRHANANNEYMEAEFDSTKESTFISYLDANNLYGWTMSNKRLGLNEWRWTWWLETSELYPSSWFRLSKPIITQPSQWLSPSCGTR